jgi:subtilisin family serine protease
MVVAAALVLLGTTAVHAADTSVSFARLLAEAKSGSNAKLGPYLITLQHPVTSPTPGREGSLRRKLPPLRTQGGYVRVSAYGDDPKAVMVQLLALGMQDARLHERAVTGRVPVEALGDMAGVAGLRFMKPVLATTRAGLTQTQGDRSMRSDLGRTQFAVDGSGVRVGILSDSFDCASGPFAPDQSFTRAGQDIVNGDLPMGVRVLQDLHSVPDAECTDEGRAMGQIVHDVAPGAALSFQTALTGEEEFAAAITALANDGARIIVDDVGYYTEPMFEDGVVARAVDDVVARGVAYFSAAGNEGRQSYQGPFRSAGRRGLAGMRHNFATGAGVADTQHLTVPPGAVSLLALGWDQTSYSASGGHGSQSDLDAIFYNTDGTPVEPCTDAPGQLVCQLPGITNNLGADAVELPIIVNLSERDVHVRLGIELVAGPAPALIKYVWYDLGSAALGVDEFDTASGTVVGHANAAGAEAVGASAWYQTGAWGSPMRPSCVPACLDSFSSAGGTPVLFDRDARRLTSPQPRVKPGVIGPDGGNTTFFNFTLGFSVPGSSEDDAFPNFFGTSAAAPHVAAVAALLIDRRMRDIAAQRRTPGGHGLTSLSPAALYTVLRDSANPIRLRNVGASLGPQPMAQEGRFSYDSGYGLVDAVRALQRVATGQEP